MVAGSLLEKLRGMSAVDCDTLDVEGEGTPHHNTTITISLSRL